MALDLSVPPKQAAQQLGRSEGTIRSMRAKERLRRLPVPDGQHGTQYAARTYGCRCEPCLEAARAHERAWAAGRPLEAKVRKAALTAVRHAGQQDQRNEIWRARSAAVAEITEPQAIRAGEPITDEDIEIACDMSMTVMEAALALGRTARAVGKIRSRYRNRHDPAQQPRNRPWTDDELAIALDESIPLEEAVTRLDRSPQAIAAKRAIAAAGADAQR
ncbi:hypothetical protein [Mycolicibacterium aubagnense]|uniref:hypothetical protein n=1 Tax=Mycolicibacterium aubagnense TaxID=319707 RepID=UPI0010FE444F|nr:hypothetical protein [Mycolicibacterium aubagnense]TLH64295.1 hypothetical protein C1S80_12885 [Mycolicibacterium aubagnense]